MNASSRKAAQLLRDRTRTQRAAQRIHRNGTASLATHVIAQGLGPKAAASVAGTLRKKTRELGLTGTTARVHAGRRMRTTTRFTPRQVALAAALYRPRIAAYKTVAARLALAA
ncbi:MAG: hypothetical protein HOZ81_50350 [Streptomyces sp.]|nr:hypothetical protein [Streptomyces sp.]NUS24376.1 hypothetical protein [Streptomyces sp.]